MKKIIWIGVFIGCILAISITLFRPDLIVAGQTCDKPCCPYLIGYDKDTGTAVCGYTFDCPYANVPSKAECDAIAPQTVKESVDQSIGEQGK